MEVFVMYTCNVSQKKMKCWRSNLCVCLFVCNSLMLNTVYCFVNYPKQIDVQLCVFVCMCLCAVKYTHWSSEIGKRETTRCARKHCDMQMRDAHCWCWYYLVTRTNSGHNNNNDDDEDDGDMVTRTTTTTTTEPNGEWGMELERVSNATNSVVCIMRTPNTIRNKPNPI